MWFHIYSIPITTLQNQQCVQNISDLITMMIMYDLSSPPRDYDDFKIQNYYLPNFKESTCK